MYMYISSYNLTGTFTNFETFPDFHFFSKSFFEVPSWREILFSNLHIYYIIYLLCIYSSVSDPGSAGSVIFSRIRITDPDLDPSNYHRLSIKNRFLDNLPYDFICFLKNSGQFKYIPAFTRVFMLPVTLIEVLEDRRTPKHWLLRLGNIQENTYWRHITALI